FGKEKLVKCDISRESCQKSVLENAHRTAALSKAGQLQDRRPVQGGGHETTALLGGGFITEGQEAKERGKK
ncbi:hypothetical protein KI387_004682, partial [Taxus chinensis]